MTRRWSLLHRAAQQGSVAGVNELLYIGSINIDGGGPDSFTPLMMAAEKGHAHVAKVLLVEGANISIVSDGGLSALALSVDQGHVAATKVLLEAGADEESKTKGGHTVLQLAAGHELSYCTWRDCCPKQVRMPIQ